MARKIPVEMIGLGRAVILAVLLGFLLAVVLYYTGLKESILHPAARLILIASVFTGGCYVSKIRASKGLVRGMSLGVGFFILMLIANLAFKSAFPGLKDIFYTLAICILAGGAGGILGIGLSEN